MNKSERTKEDMINAVIELIEETGSTDITISMIAQKADVAVGLINYHYKSKQALIIDAVRYYIEKCIEKDNVFMLNEKLPPGEQLAASFKSYADFLADHNGISRLHIKYCLDGSINGDILKQAAAYYLPMVSGICSHLNKEQMVTALMMIVSTILLSFLESGIANQTTGLDFYNKDERDRLIDNMISMTLGGDRI